MNEWPRPLRWRYMLLGLLAIGAMVLGHILGCGPEKTPPKHETVGPPGSLANTVAGAGAGVRTVVETVFVTMPPDYSDLRFWARVCLGIAVVSTLAATFLPLVPKRLPLTAAFIALGCVVAQHLLAGYLWLIVFGSVVAGVTAVVPWAVFAVRWSIKRAGARLALKPGEERAGVAVQAVADPALLRDPEKRKRMVGEAKVMQLKGGG